MDLNTPEKRKRTSLILLAFWPMLPFKPVPQEEMLGTYHMQGEHLLSTNETETVTVALKKLTV